MRENVYKLILDYEKNQTYLNLKLKEIQSDNIAQITIRVYGIFQNYLYLDYLVDELVEKKKIDKNVRIILKMQIFEYQFLNKDKHVIVNEGVELAKKYTKSAAGFINANLRKVDQVAGRVPTFASEEKNLSILYSIPRFITKRIMKQYPNEYAQILQDFTNIKTTYVRKLENQQLLNADDFQVVNPYLDLYAFTNKNITASPDFLHKNVVIQDLGSYLVGKAVAATPEEKVLDMCAAPGNKTMHIAQSANQVVANELHAHRASRLSESLTNWKIDNVAVINADGTNPDDIDQRLAEQALPLQFDKVLVDAPCSGWGVMKSKPEIKLNHQNEDIKQIVEIQQQLLEAAGNYLKTNGQLIYSTCTLNKEENENQIKMFIEKHPNYRVVSITEIADTELQVSEYGATLLPQTYNSDGFFITKLEKND